MTRGTDIQPFLVTKTILLDKVMSLFSAVCSLFMTFNVLQIYQVKINTLYFLFKLKSKQILSFKFT